MNKKGAKGKVCFFDPPLHKTAKENRQKKKNVQKRQRSILSCPM